MRTGLAYRGYGEPPFPRAARRAIVSYETDIFVATTCGGILRITWPL